jgi:hypothetical protein
MRQSARCAASRSGENRGYSQVPNAVPNGQPPWLSFGVQF